MVEKLAALMANPKASTAVRSQAFEALSSLHGGLSDRLSSGRKIDSWQAHYRYTAARIDALMTADAPFESSAVAVPPGSPI